MSHALWALASSTALALLGVGMVVPLLPLYAQRLGAAGTQVGLLYTLFSLTRALCSPLAGRASDRWGKKPLLCAAFGVYALMGWCYARAQDVLQLMAMRVVQGGASSMMLSPALAYVGELAPKGREGTYMGAFNVLLFLGFGLGPVVGGTVSQRIGMRGVFLVMGALSGVAFIVSLGFLPPDRGTSKEVRRVPWRGMLRNRLVRALLIFRSTSALGNSLSMPFLPLWAASLGVTPAQIGILFSLSVVIPGILQVPFGRLADRYDRVGLMALGGLSGVASLMLLPLCRSYGQLLLLFLITSLGGALVIPAGNALNVEIGRSYGMGSTMGIFDTCVTLGMSAGPMVGGAMMDLAGLPAAFLTGGAISLGGLALLVAWGRDAKRTALDR